LTGMDPTDYALLARVGKPWLEVVLASNLPRAGMGGAVKLKLVDFCGSVEMLAWAKDNGCPWEGRTCALLAGHGRLEMLEWAREHGCGWDEHGCEWDEEACAAAAEGGHLEVLTWAREHGCEWDERTCSQSRWGRAPRGVAVGATARLPVGWGHL